MNSSDSLTDTPSLSPAFAAENPASGIPENIRAVFFDIDDTFYSHRLDRIPEGYLDMVEQLRKRGIFCALSTARSLELVENLMGDQSGKWDGMVAGNGAFVYDSSGQILFEKTLTPEQIDQILEAGNRHGAGFFVSGTSAFVTSLVPSVKAKLDANHILEIPIRNIEESDRLSVMSVCHETPQVLKDDLEAIDGLFVHMTPLSADISRSDLSKLEGISILMSHWNLPPGNFAAFGDSLNDLEMLKGAAIGVAAAEAEPAVLQEIPLHTPPADKGGIAAWMKENGWLG